MAERSLAEFLASLEQHEAEVDEDERTLLQPPRSGAAPASAPVEVAPVASDPEAKPRPRFCRQCGTPLKPDARFCGHCGNPIP